MVRGPTSENPGSGFEPLTLIAMDGWADPQVRLNSLASFTKYVLLKNKLAQWDRQVFCEPFYRRPRSESPSLLHLSDSTTVFVWHHGPPVMTLWVFVSAGSWNLTSPWSVMKSWFLWKKRKKIWAPELIITKTFLSDSLSHIVSITNF